jgi:hypothetical protein
MLRITHSKLMINFCICEADIYAIANVTVPYVNTAIQQRAYIIEPI